MKKILMILILSLFICGCSSNNQNVDEEKIKIEEIKDIMTNSEYVIIDVRTKEEFNELHIRDAINIPYDEINESINIDKNKIIFVYCKSGNRSNIAYNTLTNLGYFVYDLGALQEIDLEKE